MRGHCGDGTEECREDGVRAMALLEVTAEKFSILLRGSVCHDANGDRLLQHLMSIFGPRLMYP